MSAPTPTEAIGAHLVKISASGPMPTSRYCDQAPCSISVFFSAIAACRARTDRAQVAAHQGVDPGADGLRLGRIAARLFLDHALEQARDEGDAARLDGCRSTGARKCAPRPHGAATLSASSARPARAAADHRAWRAGPRDRSDRAAATPSARARTDRARHRRAPAPGSVRAGCRPPRRGRPGPLRPRRRAGRGLDRVADSSPSRFEHSGGGSLAHQVAVRPLEHQQVLLIVHRRAQTHHAGRALRG